jgi:hypothetical protein
MWKRKPGSVTQACNPLISYSEEKTGNTLFEDSLGTKFQRSHLNQWLSTIECTCHLQLLGKTSRRIEVQAGQGIKPESLLKIINAKRACGVS